MWWKIENLTKIQKIILGILCAIVIILIILYVYRDKDNTVYSEYDQVYSLNDEKVEENSSSNIYVHVAGAVESPGVVELEEGQRIVDAIEKVGGLTDDAEIFEVNLAYVLKDGQKIYIPTVEEAELQEVEYITSENGKNIIVNENTDSSDVSAIININTATQTELEILTGIGPSTALKIIEYRNENGDFSSIEDIMNVSGIGESKYNSIKNNICVK